MVELLVTFGEAIKAFLEFFAFADHWVDKKLLTLTVKFVRILRFFGLVGYDLVTINGITLKNSVARSIGIKK